mmetsp:Transcript_10705/g.12136  ORF Transcript_10705/g.12136 Transcript_10705/m.12136 type:complete len:87 (+) Transcript_10705:1-261(+)
MYNIGNGCCCGDADTRTDDASVRVVIAAKTKRTITITMTITMISRGDRHQRRCRGCITVSINEDWLVVVTAGSNQIASDQIISNHW